MSRVERAAVARAVEVLRAGGLVAFPTETVYGLGADATNADAVARLFTVKGRPTAHPVIVHVASAGALDRYATDVADVARRLAAACWPGPLTLVLARRPGTIVDAVTGGRDTVGLRVPDHPLARALLDAFGGAIAAPSANRFGRVSPTTAAHVRADLGDDVDLVLDGGPCRVGVESTIVDCTGTTPVILRVGGVPEERLVALTGAPLAHRTAGEVAAPGTLAQHYAPRASVVVVDAERVVEAAAPLLDQGARVGLLALRAALPTAAPGGLEVLGAPADADEFARVLYERLREADRRGLDVVVVVAPPRTGVGAAVADRLRRAATVGG